MECNRYSLRDGNLRFGEACTDQVGSEKHAAMRVSFAPTIEEPQIQVSPVVADIEFGKN